MTDILQGQVFQKGLLPAEDRIPHPELVQLEKWRNEAVPHPERLARQRAANALEEEKRKEGERIRLAKEAREIKKA